MNMGREAGEAESIDASWLFEQIAQIEGGHADRSRIRRAVDEASRMVSEFSDNGSDNWQRWLVEASQSLGYVSRIIQGTLQELTGLASDGEFIVLRSADGNIWRGVYGSGGRRLRLLQSRSVRPVVELPRRAVEKQLAAEGFTGQLTCVVVEPKTIQSRDTSHHEEHHQSPLLRMFSLLKTERTDIGVICVFALVTGLLGMATPLAVRALVDTVSFGSVLQPVIWLSLILLTFLLFKASIKALQTWVVEIIQRRLFARLASELAWRLPRSRVDAFHGTYPPELVNRFFDVVSVQKVVSSLLLDGVSLMLSMIVGMIVLAFYHPYLLAFDFVLIGLMILVYLLGRGAVNTSIRESRSKYAMAAWLEDMARCSTAFRYDGAPEFALEKSDRLIYEYIHARTKHFRVLMRQLIAILLVQALGSTALLAIGGWLVLNGQLSLGQLVAAELIVAIVVDSFAKMSKHIESFYDLLASVDKIGHLLDLRTERTDGLLTIPSGAGFVIQDVAVHDHDRHSVLNPISLTIRPGERIAISGDDSSGKSLLLDVLFGLREPEHGAVSFNGLDPRDLRPDVLRRRVALIRDIEIFDGSIAENVHLERPDVSIADVRTALEAVGLLPRIQQLPHGLDTALNPSGAPLTPAQCRRLMIARAIAGRPEILLVDEILDALPDTESETILRKILAADNSWTIVVVTSRPNLQRMLNRVLEIRPSRDHEIDRSLAH
jgi:ABC-type bacteriocin/lantibiotic exporter with double-glycine peptidase domain